MTITKAIAIASTVALAAMHTTSIMAGEVTIKGLSCWGGEVAKLLTHDENNLAGIAKFSTAVNSDIDDRQESEQCVSAWSFMDGQFEDSGYCIGKTATGDTWIAKFAGKNGKGTYTYLKGTGTMEGVKGDFSYEAISFPQITPETFSGCATHDGGYTTPSQ